MASKQHYHDNFWYNLLSSEISYYYSNNEDTQPLHSYALSLVVHKKEGKLKVLSHFGHSS